MNAKPLSFSVLDLTRIALFTALIAICAWICIPATVPFTLQTFGVFLTAGMLGGRRASLAVLCYLALGAVGVPVFAGFTGGIGVLLGNTGGFLVGFLFSTLIMWALEFFLQNCKGGLLLRMVIGLIVCYAFGTAWLMIVYYANGSAVGLATALGWCVFPYLLPDALKIVLALVVCKRLSAVC